MTENHFRSHFSPFQINTQLFIFFHKMAAGGHFVLDDRKSLLIAFLAISDQKPNFHFFSQNGCRLPFWMSENHFRSHFSPFQINMQLLLIFTKWLPAAILDDRKSLLIAFFDIFHNVEILRRMLVQQQQNILP